MDKKIGFGFYKKDLEILTRKLKETKDDVRVLAIVLFGSVARREANLSSDIDLIIVYDGEEEEMSRCFYRLKEGMDDEHFSSRLWPIFLDRGDLREHPHILLDVLDHGMILYDTGVMKERLRALEKRLGELGAKKVELANGKWYWDLKPDWKPGELIEL